MGVLAIVRGVLSTWYQVQPLTPPLLTVDPLQLQPLTLQKKAALILRTAFNRSLVTLQNENKKAFSRTEEKAGTI